VPAALREDALTATSAGFELRIGLPWIRSMPLSSIIELTVSVDGRSVDPSELRVLIGGRRVAPADLGHETDRWWYLQDRLVLVGPAPVRPGRHRVIVDFRLLVPYLSAAPTGPLVLPHRVEADLDPDCRMSPSVARDVA